MFRSPINPPRLRLGLLVFLIIAQGAIAGPTYVTDPGNPGPDLPPIGRSLFDRLTIVQDRQRIAFPFDALVLQLAGQADAGQSYLGQVTKSVLIPHGRSLQRSAAAPDFFASPRIVVAFDAPPPADAENTSFPLLQDRLYIAYMPAADALEIISYNDSAGRFEFQLVSDYRQGGRPEAVYARRVVCIACHQNHAPIFARPLWDETNANPKVAARLAVESSGFFGVSVSHGVDVAYAIDNATDRANDFALTQTLWTEGCGEGIAGKRCRAALFLAALQYRLSGNRGFQANPELSAHMQRMRAQRWPHGLLLISADIPNRRPMQILETPGVDAQTAAANTADIEAASEPLRQRPAELWNPDTDAWIKRAVKGIAAFLTDRDLQLMLREDEPLATGAVRSVKANCRLSERFTTALRVRVFCDHNALELDGLFYRDSLEKPWRGRLSRLNIGAEAVGAVNVRAGELVDPENLMIKRPGDTGPVFMADGSRIVQLSLRPAHGTGTIDAATSPMATVTLQLQDDFEAVRSAVALLSGWSDSPFKAQPFPRDRLLSELRSAMTHTLASNPSIRDCCSDVSYPPPKTTSPQPPLVGDTLLDPFLLTCGACHRSSEPFPPNFLSGDRKQVRQAIGQCAQRIAYRLAMWDLPSGLRAKTPMPPHTAQHVSEDELNAWRKGLLLDLRQALDALTTLTGEALMPIAALIQQPYAGLRPCIAPALVKPGSPSRHERNRRS